MKKNLFVLLTILFSSYTSFSQELKSPDQFLGYQLGDKYTPHYKIVNYFQQAALAMPKMMKLEQYGSTNEGRPLLLAFVASPENFTKLEEIRKNNLRLTGMLNDKPGDVSAPTIVWLSYNVHGNETSSSEVAMKTLYELLNPNNAQTKEWLKNTVVIIDPCLNPDGRDRYVNWFTQVSGKKADPNTDAREHSEPWPGGRTNHYNFDLNRDWAWQTQIETQGRVKKYNDWMPQIHCDFHEQGVNSPYYFAPAAEPFHEVITQWQRNFQYTIGKNHAKYFDANGWLYFTKEIFDLFYPAYGDTYPIYNGAIGMTYEQAGGPGGGAAALKSDGDTLTLKDRIAHHFTTSMSTLEIASVYNSRLVSEFKKFFDDAKNNGVGDYKTYIITETNANKLKPLQNFFDVNGIKYGSISTTAIKGYNYSTGKEEVFTAVNGIAVSAYQPKSTLIKVLFEPKSKLVDSVTYDITAWSLPYVYGVQTYAVREKIATGIYAGQPAATTVAANAYGYLINYASFEDARLLVALLNEKIKLRFAEKDFTYGGKAFKKGALIVLKKGNEDKLAALMELSKKYNAAVTSVASGFMETGFDFGSEKVHFIKKPNVAMLTGKGVNSGGAGEVWHLFEQQLDYPITLINADEINGAALKNMDVLILPDGNYKFFADKDAAAEIKNWVQQGGKIIAMENGASQMAKADWGFKLKKDDDEKKDDKKDDKNLYADVKRFENRERESIADFIPGSIYKVTLDDSHPLAFGYTDNYFTLKQNGDLYEFMKDGWNVGVIKKDNQVAGFVGSRLKDKLKDGTVLGVQDLGRGSIVFFADDPIFRSFWENGKLLFANAVFLVGQ
ncbi:M14 metallopeptidase family protein [Ferruginibacter sp. SUN106]|uniref:M14 family metallopeptidase n=1 Tax=Ferruginibacter sp. SUN106 TaxID=2978348 RepID=UPI003D36C91C